MFYKKELFFDFQSKDAIAKFLARKESVFEFKLEGFVSPKSNKYSFTKDWNQYIIVREDSSPLGVKLYPDAYLKVNEQELKLEVTIQYSQIWKFFGIILYLIFIAAAILMFTTNNSSIIRSLGVLCAPAIFELLSFAYFRTEALSMEIVIRDMVEKSKNKD